MNEGRTSTIFAAVAALSLALAWWSRPDAISNENDLIGEVTGQPVFAKFEDPAAAESFQIIKYDEALGQLERFEVAKDKAAGMWKLPSYDDYPADAAEQVRDATTPLISMPILSVASLDKGDHALYGVVNPDDESLSVGESGVGMLVRVKGDANQVLAELVIGKEVQGSQGQRYVRVPTEDATYVVEINTAPFTTDFQKWINQELLAVRSFDIAQVGLRDYAILPTQNGYGMSRNFDADLNFDSAANKWSLERLVTYENGKAEPDQIEEGKKLNDTALNDLRNAVQDLQIVNVRRKPKGLAADLKADKSLMENKESLQSLVSQGFIPQESAEGTEIFATGGETLIGTQDGVKYLLRFGESVTNLSSAEQAEEESGLRRYLLVSAVLDESKFPAPDLEPLPETVEEMLERQKKQAAATAPAAADAAAPATDAQSTPNPAVQEPSSEKQAPEEPAKEEPAKEEPAPAESTTEAPAAQEPSSQQSASPKQPASDDTAAGDKPAADPNDCAPQEEGTEATTESTPTDQSAAPAAEPTTAEAPQNAAENSTTSQTAAPTETTTEAKDAAPASPQSAAPPKTDEELKEELEFVREQIAKDNQRKIDERKEKMDAARKRVSELNARFADWYYVVSDSVYKKLKISRDQLIVADTPAAPATTSPQPPSFDLQP